MNTPDAKDYQALDELKVMSRAVNYNKWIWQTIRPFLGKCIVEVGAGIGTFTDYLAESGTIYATDIAQNCIVELNRRFNGRRNITIEEFDITSSPDANLWSGRGVDTIICLNVLEHIEDDVAALRNMNSILKTGGNIILMVPAFQCAYGTIDKLDGHFRRYSSRGLSSRITLASLCPESVRYFNSVGLFAWFYTNKIARNRVTSKSKVEIYDKYIVSWLSLLEGIILPPFGQSLIAVGKKQ